MKNKHEIKARIVEVLPKIGGTNSTNEYESYQRQQIQVSYPL